MLVFPAPPRILPRNPSLASGAYAKPILGAKLVYLVGPRVRGMPGSPGTTKPRGAPGKDSDCSPATTVSSLFWVSYQGVAASQRRPEFTARVEDLLAGLHKAVRRPNQEIGEVQPGL